MEGSGLKSYPCVARRAPGFALFLPRIGLTPATLQRLVAELLAISPEQVEVAKEFADEQ